MTGRIDHEWLDTLYRNIGEITEITLKAFSWTLMNAAIGYAADKSHSVILAIANHSVTLLIVIYALAHFHRLERAVFPTGTRTLRGREGFIFLLVVALTIGSLTLSGAVVNAIIETQTHPQ
jgi:hypothetical protein